MQAGDGVGAVEHVDPCLRGAGREHFARGMVGDYTRDGGFEVSPHQEERRPREELRDAQPHHHAGDVAHEADEAHRFGVLLGEVVVAGELPGRIFPCLERGDEHREQQDRAPGIVGVGDVRRNMPRSGLVRHAEPCHDERQDSADDRTEVYQEGLYHVALCLLRIVEHVGHQRPEGLHRDVERQIHEQQDESPHGERGEGEQFGAVGHEHQRQRRDQRPAQDVGDAAAPARPGAVGKEPHDGLDDHAGQRCRQPEVAQVADICPQRFEDARRVGILERISDLHAEEAEAEVPNLPK